MFCKYVSLGGGKNPGVPSTYRHIDGTVSAALFITLSDSLSSVIEGRKLGFNCLWVEISMNG